MAQTRNSVTDIWGARTPYHHDWPVRVDEQTSDTPESWVQSACLLCSNGCGLDIGVKDGQIVGGRGRGDDRVNHGRLGPKGLHGGQANHSPERLTPPLIRRGGRFHEVGWDEAMDMIVRRSKEIRDRYSSSALGFYTSGAHQAVGPAVECVARYHPPLGAADPCDADLPLLRAGLDQDVMGVGDESRRVPARSAAHPEGSSTTRKQPHYKFCAVQIRKVPPQRRTV